MKILNQHQAEAVYSAMCVLNNVGGKLDSAKFGEHILVHEDSAGQVMTFSNEQPAQIYANQTDFAAAYGLNQASTQGAAE